MVQENVAIIITAYKDKENLCSLLEVLSGFSIYLHVDAKSAFAGDIYSLKEKYNLKYVNNRFTITWGSPAHLSAIIHLMREVAVNDKIEYVHIISGQDFPVVSNDKIVSFSHDFRENIFLTCQKLSDIKDKSIKSRVSNRLLFSSVNLKSWLGTILGVLGRIQIFFPRKSLGNYPSSLIYKGMIWGSFPIEFLKFAINEPGLNFFLKDLDRTKIAEEFFFQTIAMNSKWESVVINDNLRYTDWSGRNGSNPSVLDMSDIDEIQNSNCLFARKVDSIISSQLREVLLNSIK